MFKNKRRNFLIDYGKIHIVSHRLGYMINGQSIIDSYNVGLMELIEDYCSVVFYTDINGLHDFSNSNKSVTSDELFDRLSIQVKKVLYDEAFVYYSQNSNIEHHEVLKELARLMISKRYMNNKVFVKIWTEFIVDNKIIFADYDKFNLFISFNEFAKLEDSELSKYDIEKNDLYEAISEMQEYRYYV